MEKNEYNSESNRNKHSRRQILASTTAIGLGVGSLSTVSAGETETEIPEVDMLKGRSRDAALRDVRTDREFKLLSRELAQSGYRQDISNAKVTETTPRDGSSHRTAVIPFETNASDEQVVIGWSDRDDLTTHSEIVSRTGASEWELSVQRVTNEPADQPTARTADTSAIKTTTEPFDMSVVSSELTAQDDPTDCGQWDVGCGLMLAGAYSDLFWSCANCTNWWSWSFGSCGQCVAAILTSSGATLFCNPCL